MQASAILKQCGALVDAALVGVPTSRTQAELLNMTEVDRKSLALLPDGWFFPEHDASFMIKNPLARCRRLESQGVLESKIEETPSGRLKRFYRKL